MEVNAVYFNKQEFAYISIHLYKFHSFFVPRHTIGMESISNSENLGLPVLYVLGFVLTEYKACAN